MKTYLIVALAGLLLAAQCDPMPPAPPAPAPTASSAEPAPTPPPAPSPAPTPAPSPAPTPEPPFDPAPPSDVSRCAQAYRNGIKLSCPPTLNCPDGGVCPNWVEFCKADESNGISVGSKCIAAAADCSAIAKCVGKLGSAAARH